MSKSYVVTDAKRLELVEAALKAVRLDMLWETLRSRQDVIDAFAAITAYEEGL